VLRDEAAARTQRGLALVTAGEFGEGWDEYRFRFEAGGGVRRLRQPAWAGEPLEGKSILVHREQGVGDEIWFAGCLPDLVRERPARILLSCDVRLEPLFSRSFPGIELLSGEPGVDDWERFCDLDVDYQLPLGCLHRWFRRRREDFPTPADYRGYLQADTALTAFWRRRHRELGGERAVGVSWQGGRTLMELRKLPWDALVTLLASSEATFFDLQYGDTSEVRQRLSEVGARLHAQPDTDAWLDLDGLAARIAALDLVITVPNTTAHLAGALGVPTFILHSPAWGCCWLPEGERTPWYPCARVFRKGRGGWPAVLESLSNELRRLPGVATSAPNRATGDPTSTVQAAARAGGAVEPSRTVQLASEGPAGAVAVGFRPFADLLVGLAPGSVAEVALRRCEANAWLAARGGCRTIGLLVASPGLREDAAVQPLVRATPQALPLADRSVDWILAFDVLHRMTPEEVDVALAELTRVAVRGVLVSVDTAPASAWVSGRLINVHQTVRPLRWWSARIAEVTGVRPLHQPAGRGSTHALLASLRDRR
jgi:hypothetical protein